MEHHDDRYGPWRPAQRRRVDVHPLPLVRAVGDVLRHLDLGGVIDAWLRGVDLVRLLIGELGELCGHVGGHAVPGHLRGAEAALAGRRPSERLISLARIAAAIQADVAPAIHRREQHRRSRGLTLVPCERDAQVGPRCRTQTAPGHRPELRRAPTRRLVPAAGRQARGWRPPGSGRTSWRGSLRRQSARSADRRAVLRTCTCAPAAHRRAAASGPRPQCRGSTRAPRPIRGSCAGGLHRHSSLRDSTGHSRSAITTAAPIFRHRRPPDVGLWRVTIRRSTRGLVP